MVFAVDTTWRWRTVVGGYTGDASFISASRPNGRWMTGEAKDSPRAMSAWTDRYRYQPGQSVQLNIDLQGPPTNTAESKDAKATRATRSPPRPRAARGTGKLRQSPRMKRVARSACRWPNSPRGDTKAASPRVRRDAGT